MRIPLKERRNFGHVQNGHYKIGKKFYYFRSKMEANYAIYLNFLKEKGDIKSWEFEPQTFWFEGIRRGTNNYKPDFKVGNKNGTEEWHEVKGFMDAKSKTKIKRMAKYFPAVKLIVVGVEAMNDIKSKVGRMLKFY